MFKAVWSVLFVSLSLSAVSFASEFRCVDQLSNGSENFLHDIANREILFAFNDGDVHQLVLHQNEFGIWTGQYGNRSGEIYYRNMVALDCVDIATSEHFIQFYMDKTSPIGTYKYAAMVLLPRSTALVQGKQLTTSADLRWVAWKHPQVIAR